MVDGTVATELNGKISVSSGIVVLAVDERIENINVKIRQNHKDRENKHSFPCA